MHRRPKEPSREDVPAQRRPSIPTKTDTEGEESESPIPGAPRKSRPLAGKRRGDKKLGECRRKAHLTAGALEEEEKLDKSLSPATIRNGLQGAETDQDHCAMDNVLYPGDERRAADATPMKDGEVGRRSNPESRIFESPQPEMRFRMEGLNRVAFFGGGPSDFEVG